MIDFRKKNSNMELIVEIILLMCSIVVFALNCDVKALQCYECNKEFLFDPKCNNITMKQKKYLVKCDSSAVQCIRVINYGQFSVPNTYDDSTSELDEEEDELVTSRKCATQETMDWCLSLSYPSINCDYCNTTGCNGYDMNP